MHLPLPGDLGTSEFSRVHGEGLELGSPTDTAYNGNPGFSGFRIFFNRCQRPAKCAGDICRAESAEKEPRRGWTHSDLLLKTKCNLKANSRSFNSREEMGKLW